MTLGVKAGSASQGLATRIPARSAARPRKSPTILCLATALALIVANATSSAQQRLSGATIPEGKIVDVRFEGNESIPVEKILAEAKIRSRAGRPLDRTVLDEDLKRLFATKWFADVAPIVEKTEAPDEYILIFRVREMPVLKSVEFRGMKSLKLKDVEESTGLKKGARADAIRAKLAVSQIKELLKEKGFEQAEVELVEGGKPSDTSVVIRVFEGPKRKVRSITFTGNTFVSDSILYTKVVNKPRLFGLLGSKFERDGFEDDARRLREYYQSNGFLAADIRAVVRSAANLGDEDVNYVIDEGPRFRVRKVVFEGNEKLGVDQLNKDLKLHSNEFFNDGLQSTDRKLIESRYFSIGCIDARIAVEPRYTDRPDVIDLVYRIEEGDVYRMGSLIVRGNARTQDRVVRREADMAGLLPGEILDLNRIETYKARLGNLGYFVLDPQQGRPLDVRIVNRRPADKPYGDTVQPDLGGIIQTRMQNAEDIGGPEEDQPPPGGARLEAPEPLDGPAEVMPFGGGSPSRIFSPPPDTLPPMTVPVAPRGGPGAPRGRDSVLNSNTPPGTMPSTPLNARNDVGPDRQEPFANRAYADIITNVDETETGRLLFAVGASSLGGLSGSFVLHESNFDLFAVPRSFADIGNGRAFRGRGQEFRLELSPGTLINRYIVSFRDPYLFDLPIGFGVSGYQFSRFYAEYNEIRGGGRFSLGRQFGTQTYANVDFRVEDVNVRGFQLPAPAELLAASGHTTLASIRPSLRFDNRNNPFNPSTGSYLEIAYEQTWGTFTYPKFTIEGRRHFTTGSRPDGSGKRILTLRGFYGVSGPDTPIYERFYAGDFRSFRGFSYRGVGPHVMNVSTGGVMSFLGSVEYQFPLAANDKLHQVIFCDFGTVESGYNFTSFRSSVGTGLRVIIPQLTKQVPMAFDLAFPLSKEPEDRTRIFTFSIAAFY